MTVIDTFNRANGDLSVFPGYVSDTGQHWFGLSGSWNIVSNQVVELDPGSGTQRAIVIDDGHADGIVQIDLIAYEHGSGNSGLTFRAVDNSHYLRAVLEPITPAVYVQENNAGFTTLATYPITLSSAPATLSVTLNGPVITTMFQGVVLGSVSDSFQQSATKHGLQSSPPNFSGAPTTIWDNFSFRPFPLPGWQVGSIAFG